LIVQQPHFQPPRPARGKLHKLSKSRLGQLFVEAAMAELIPQIEATMVLPLQCILCHKGHNRAMEAPLVCK
jgi:hypothetical protein